MKGHYIIDPFVNKLLKETLTFLKCYITLVCVSAIGNEITLKYLFIINMLALYEILESL